MADWALEYTLRKYRAITDDKSTSDSELIVDLNDYYQNIFPIESQLKRFETDFVQVMAVSDDGNYLIDEDYLDLLPPYTIDNFPTENYSSKTKFDARFPLETDPMNLTDPNLAIGSSSAAAVANSAFSFRIRNHSYSKAATETALSGDTLPQSKYGAWRLEIGSDGDISIVEADGNATGYDSAAQAVKGLGAESSDNCCMGFITVINTSGTFIPGTTELDATGVTATYTDGYHTSRGTPYGFLLDGREFWVGPKPDGIHVLNCRAVKRPDAITSGTSPLDASWGIVIAYGAAILRNFEDKDETIQAHIAAKDHFMNIIRRPQLKQSSQKRSQPRC